MPDPDNHSLRYMNVNAGHGKLDPMLAGDSDVIAVGEAPADEVFSFDRTISRLHEMQSHAYLIRAATKGPLGHCLAPGNRTPPLLYESGSALTEVEAEELWDSYDLNVSGWLEHPEVRFLLQDLCGLRRGHRNVCDESATHVIELMDADGDGKVSKRSFIQFTLNAGLRNVTFAEVQ